MAGILIPAATAAKTRLTATARRTSPGGPLSFAVTMAITSLRSQGVAEPSAVARLRPVRDLRRPVQPLLANDASRGEAGARAAPHRPHATRRSVPQPRAATLSADANGWRRGSGRLAHRVLLPGVSNLHLPTMANTEFYRETKWCDACSAHVRYLASINHSYCIDCGGRVRLFRPAEKADVGEAALRHRYQAS